MNPIKISKQLQDTLISYLTTTFDVNRDGQEPDLAKFIEKSFKHPRSLFAGPYLELTPPHKTSETLQQLITEGVLSTKLLEMECFREGRPIPVDAELYTHQAKAFRKLCSEERNIVVSSGTGSGKTECFLIPILNDLLIDNSDGVRAVLIYPLNALVNDQLDRLRELLRDRPDITFGRYTSELEEKSESARRQMRQEWEQMEPTRQRLFAEYPLPNEIIGRDQIREGELPHILITNYAMLEYLLLRPEDSPLFSKGKWRFVVLDEAHSYAGAQGIEVGLLMRRLKLRLEHQPGQTRCIATSATLTNDDAKDTAQFAQALFGENFTEEDVIFGELNHDYVPDSTPSQPGAEVYIHERFEQLIENIRKEQWESTDEIALLMQEIGLISEDQLRLADKCTPPQLLWEVLRGNEDLTQLRKIMADAGQPMEMISVADKLFHRHLPTKEDRQNALYHLIELAAMARPQIDKPSLLPARYHLFVRPPQGVWACINPACPDKQDRIHWAKLFATPRETCDVCQAPVYPLVVCRTCGQVYVQLKKVGKEYLPDAAPELGAQKHYVTLRPIRENRALTDQDTNDRDDEDTLVEQAGEGILVQSELTLCLTCKQKVNANGRCACTEKSQQIISVNLLKKARPVKRGKTSGIDTGEIIEEMNECGRCHSQALKGTEIATEISLNALTPLAILTDELYRQLPESSNHEIQTKAGNGRKLLSFYDSRQGAARFAAFVQDIVNQQNYRRIIREAVQLTATNTHFPDLEKVSDTVLRLALQYRVAHNDLSISKGELPREPQYLSQSQRERLTSYMCKQILAEITTHLRSRQSLEALGLIAVQYFEPDRVPDFGELATKLNLTIGETRALVEYLLDDLRRGKVVQLPKGIDPSDTIFGRNKFSPRLVRQAEKPHEISWFGKTTRHRRRQMIAKILRHKQLANNDAAIEKALGEILEWLHRSDLLDTSRPNDGYQLRYDRLFFQHDAQWFRCSECQRLSCRGNALPCPHAYCNGFLQSVNLQALETHNFYYNNLRQELIPLRIEEHTAQLAPQKGRDYQNQFKNGNINMLSCSTTFEMGINLGDLQGVVMSNIPPTVANYKQRAGRAGRNASGTAFILAWSSSRPHDQSYFKNPAEIIGGRVRVPFIEIRNPIIIQRHVNAILLSEFLRYCAGLGRLDALVGTFFDEQTPNGAAYALLSNWQSEKQKDLLDRLASFAIAVKQSIVPSRALESFLNDILQKGYEHFSEVGGYYKNVLQEKAQEQLKAVMDGNTQSIGTLTKEIERYSRLLDRIRDENIINYLSDRGVLPSYSFPLHVVELRIPPHLLDEDQLRLQRNLQQAIREYAPGQEVVADKRIWKSEALDFFGKEPIIYAYYICPNCNRLTLSKTPGQTLDQSNQICPVCFAPFSRDKQFQYIQPDGFRASNDSGMPAGQYVDRPFNLMRSALVPRSIEPNPVSRSLSIGYDRLGELLYVNEGFEGKGFKICLKCGKQVSKRAIKCDGMYNGQHCQGQLDQNVKLTLGYRQGTDTLHLGFSNTSHISLPPPENFGFWLSLKYALLNGASRALQIERKDIDGVLFPESSSQTWIQSIVLYDNVPGGAGHVKQIEENIAQVVAAALEIVDCQCERSCYHCLKEYGNQWEHHLLDRTQIIDFLRALDADLQQSQQGNDLGLHPVVAINPTIWLWERVQNTQKEIVLNVAQITLKSPTSEGVTWLDLIQNLLQRGIRVRLFLNQLPDQASGDQEAIGITAHLALLVRKGLDLRHTIRRLPWSAIIDPSHPSAIAIAPNENSIIALSDSVGSELFITHVSESVSKSWQSIESYRGQMVELGDLREPADIYVKEVTPDGKRHNEAEFFTEFYTKYAVKGMVISDRYLDNRDKILDRLGAHIQLAQQQQTLEWVLVKTRQTDDLQHQAIQQLKSRYPSVNIKFEFSRNTAHDRYIEVAHVGGSKARVIIGCGLDFIESTGSVRNTFLIFQNAM